MRKLGFLKGVWLCLFKEYRELEERFGTHFTEKISSGDADRISMQEVKKLLGNWTERKGLSDVKRKLHRLPWYRGWLRLWTLH